MKPAKAVIAEGKEGISASLKDGKGLGAALKDGVSAARAKTVEQLSAAKADVGERLGRLTSPGEQDTDSPPAPASKKGPRE